MVWQETDRKHKLLNLNHFVNLSKRVQCLDTHRQTMGGLLFHSWFMSAQSSKAQYTSDLEENIVGSLHCGFLTKEMKS